MDKLKLLITGGNGYIATSLYNKLKDKYEITTITRKDFDLTSYYDARKWFNEKYFDVVIHTAIVGGSRLKIEDQTILDQNLMMYENLLSNKQHFNKFISFGSGAEIFQPNTPYGISKKTISNSIQNIKNFYNLRIFAVFDENELNTRFIKANILRYIKKEPMIVHTDKIMDFFYMKDLVHLVNHYITKNNLSQTINCSYSQKYTLTNIAEIINNLDKHKVPIIIENKNKLEFYCGESHNMPIKIIGLETGIYNTYNKLSSGDLINA